MTTFVLLFSQRMQPIEFREKLREWAARHPREMPWKGVKDPYLIWLSEVILQQTRVEQGWPYYERFVDCFPTVTDLANAPESEIFRLWAGLGYYSRAKNLHKAAKVVEDQYGGSFPRNYQAIRALPGVGDYTAAAVCSFAFNMPYAVLDGNVFRILSRYFGIDTPIDTSAGKKQFAQMAQDLLDTAHPGSYNQAMMDFGATWCTPVQPRCHDCPMADHCVAFLTSSTARFPVKSKKMVRKQRFFLYLVPEIENGFLMRKRTGKDIWENLYEFPCAEPDHLNDPEALVRQFFAFLKNENLIFSQKYKQLLTHREVYAVFVQAPAAALPPTFLQGCEPVDTKGNVPVPGIIAEFLKKNKNN